MKIVRSIRQMKDIAAGWCREGKRIAFVPTMGALHAGHVSLVEAAKSSGGKVVVSIFVNPLQFGPKEDFQRYPRTLRQDARLLSRLRVDVLFYPDAAGMFPMGFGTGISVAGFSDRLCGKFRPGHFQGVATVVAKLFAIVRPTVAFFGQKDYQQCKMIERMTSDLDLGVEIRMMPVVREKDGLAMSSRNRYLSESDRCRAAGIFQALAMAYEAVRQGQRGVRILKAKVRRELHQWGIAHIDYVEIVDGFDLRPLKKVRPPAVMAVAVRVGDTRLIDNVILAS